MRQRRRMTRTAGIDSPDVDCPTEIGWAMKSKRIYNKDRHIAIGIDNERAITKLPRPRAAMDCRGC